MATKLCPLRNNKYGSLQDCNEIFCMLWDKEEENCLISSALQRYLKGYTNKEQEELQKQIKMAALGFDPFPFIGYIKKEEI